MASTGISAFGTLLKAGDGASPEVFTTLAEVFNITGPSPTAEQIEITNHSSPSNYREYVAGFLDGGEISFSANFLPANATQSDTAGLLNYFKNRTEKNWQIVFPDTGNSTAAFAAFVATYTINAPVDDRLSVDATLKIDGAVTWS